MIKTLNQFKITTARGPEISVNFLRQTKSNVIMTHNMESIDHVWRCVSRATCHGFVLMSYQY